MEMCMTDSDGETIVFNDENEMVNIFKDLDSKRDAEITKCNNTKNVIDHFKKCFEDTVPVYLSSPWEGGDGRTTGLVDSDVDDLHSVAVYNRNRTRNGTSLVDVCERYSRESNEGTNACFTIHNHCEQSRGQVQNCQHRYKTDRASQSSLIKWHESRYYRMKINRNSIITTPKGFSDFIRVNQNVLHKCWQKEIVATKKHCKKDLQNIINDLTESAASNGMNDIILELLESPREDANLIDKVVEVHNQMSKRQLCVATPPKDHTEPRIRIVTPHFSSGEIRNLNNESSLMDVRNHILRSTIGTPTDVRRVDTSVVLRKTERHHKKLSTKNLQWDTEKSKSSCSEDKNYMTETEESQQKKEKRIRRAEKYKRVYESGRKLYSSQTESESEDGYRRMKRPIKHKDKHRDKNYYISWKIKQQNKKQEGQIDMRSEKAGIYTETQGRKGNWKCNHKSFHLIKEMSCKVGSLAEELFKTICKRHKLKSDMRRNGPRQATKEEVEYYEAEPEFSPDLEVTILERTNVSEKPMDACVRVSKLAYQPSECRDKPVNNSISDEKHRKRSDEERRDDQAAGKEECRIANEVEKGKDDNAISEKEYRKEDQDEKMKGDPVEEKEELRESVSQQMHKEGNEDEKEKSDTTTGEEKNRKGNDSEKRQDSTVSEEEYRKGSEGENGRDDTAMSEEECKKGNQVEKRKCVHIEKKVEALRENASQPVHKKVKIKTEPVTLEAQNASCADQITSALLDYEEGQCVVQTQNVQSDFGSMVAVKTKNFENTLSIMKTEPGLSSENNLESTEITMYKEQLKMEDLSIVVKTETLEEEAYPASMEDIRDYLNTLGMPALKSEY